MTAIHWRSLTTLDLPQVEAIAAHVHPGFFEDVAIFAERQRLYPDGARFLQLDGQPGGYLLSHPWRTFSVPPLNMPLGAIPPDAQTYYIHDLALLPEARGSGAAGLAVAELATHARKAGFATMSLVAVNSSQPFWERQGFVAVPVPALAEKLHAYEEAARFMVRRLD